MPNPLDWIADKILNFFFAVTHIYATPETKWAHKKSAVYGALQEIFRFLFTIGILFFLIKTFFIQPFLVQQESMVPTIQPYDYIIADRFTYQFLHEPKRGEVIIFRSGPENNSRYLIKRIVGLPGEKITVDGPETIITNNEHPDGFALNETYVQNIDTRTKKIVTLQDDEYFVMGDNRPTSLDSRSSQVGPITRDQIVGRTLIRLYPFTQIDIFPGTVDVSEKKP